MPVIKRKVGGKIGSKLARKALPGGSRRKLIQKAHSKLKVREAGKKVGSPVNVKRRDRDEVGDSSVDHESGFSKDVTEQVGTRGEKVSTGAGTRARSFPEEQTTKRSRKFRKGVVDLESKVNDGTATKAEKAKYKRIIDKDEADQTRAARTAARTRAKWNPKKEAAWQQKAEDAYINNGEILKHPQTKKDYEPSLAVQRRAERGLTARKQSPSERKGRASVEQSLKRGGKINSSKRKSKSTPKGVGAAQRGWGATGKS